MFHHGVMEPEDMARASELLALLAAHENVVAAADGRAQSSFDREAGLAGGGELGLPGEPPTPRGSQRSVNFVR